MVPVSLLPTQLSWPNCSKDSCPSPSLSMRSNIFFNRVLGSTTDMAVQTSVQKTTAAAQLPCRH